MLAAPAAAIRLPGTDAVTVVSAGCVVASGARYRRPAVDRLAEFEGRGEESVVLEATARDSAPPSRHGRPRAPWARLGRRSPRRAPPPGQWSTSFARRRKVVLGQVGIQNLENRLAGSRRKLLDLLETTQSKLHHGTDISFAGGIRGEGFSLPAGGANLLDNTFRLGQTRAAIDDDAGSGAGKFQRDLAADSPGGTGHERKLTFQ